MDCTVSLTQIAALSRMDSRLRISLPQIISLGNVKYIARETSDDAQRYGLVIREVSTLKPRLPFEG